MGGHASMSKRVQRTPFGEVSIGSRWHHDEHYLVAYGPAPAVGWMFPKDHGFQQCGIAVRHLWKPDPDAKPITDIREVEKACRRWQAAWDQKLEMHEHGVASDNGGSAAAPAPRTLGELVEHVRTYFPPGSPTTGDKHADHMKKWLAHLGSATPITSISPEAIISARTAMLAQHGFSHATANNHLRTLKAHLNRAHRRGWVSVAAWDEVRELKEQPKEVQHWDEHQLAVAFAVAAPGTSTLVLAVAALTGCRKGEADTLRWRDLLLDRTDPLTGRPTPIAEIAGRKNARDTDFVIRRVPLIPQAVDIFRRHRPADAGPDDYVLAARLAKPKRGGTKRVYRWDSRVTWEGILDAAKRAGNPHIKFHALRHSFAILAFRAGAKEKDVEKWLGHKDGRMIAQHYARWAHFETAPEAMSIPTLPAELAGRVEAAKAAVAHERETVLEAASAKMRAAWDRRRAAAKPASTKRHAR